MVNKELLNWPWPWWWSSGQRARLLLLRSEFESRWSLKFLYNIVFGKNENKQKRGRGWPTFKKNTKKPYFCNRPFQESFFSFLSILYKKEMIKLFATEIWVLLCGKWVSYKLGIPEPYTWNRFFKSAAIAQLNRLRFPYYLSGFESQAHHLSLCVMWNRRK